MEIIRQPKNLFRNFLINPSKYLIEYCNLVGSAISPFIVFPEKISKMFSYNLINPFHDDLLNFDKEFKCENPEVPRYMHLDLAKNHDAAGLSMCHSPYFVDAEEDDEGATKKGEKLPFVRFDFIGRMKAKSGEEILIEEIEDMIYYLTSLGFNFRFISFDRFASLYIIQNLKKQGFVAAQMSVERSAYRYIRVQINDANPEGFRKISTNKEYLMAMETFKELLYQERIAIPYHPVLETEIKKANIDRIKGKVDHQIKGSIDIFHSVAGSCFNLINNIVYGGQMSEEDQKNISDPFYKRYQYERQETPSEESFEDDFYVDGDYY